MQIWPIRRSDMLPGRTVHGVWLYSATVHHSTFVPCLVDSVMTSLDTQHKGNTIVALVKQDITQGLYMHASVHLVCMGAARGVDGWGVMGVWKRCARR